MSNIKFNQYKSPRSYYIAVPLIIFGFLGWGNWDQVLILLTMGILLIGFRSYYIISSEFKNKIGYSFFGLTFFKGKLNILSPDYISLFSINQKRSNEYGPVSALGSISKDSFFIIRLFKENKHFTIYKSKDYTEVRTKAVELSNMLNVELIDKIKR